LPVLLPTDLLPNAEAFRRVCSD